MPAYLVDTNILIQAIRRKRERSELLRQLVEAGGTLACSVITVAELYAGMREHESVRTTELIDCLELYDITGSIARQAGRLKNEWAGRGYQFTLADMLIASTALTHDLVLLTDNQKDFPMLGARLYSALQ